mgnify:CR=1 FL=1
MGMAEWMPKRRASYEAAETTPRPPGDAPTTTGRPRSSGPVPLLDGRVERVHVHVDDRPDRGRGSGHGGLLRGAPRPSAGATAVSAPMMKPQVLIERHRQLLGAARDVVAVDRPAKALVLELLSTEAGSSSGDGATGSHQGAER